jgi:hypothetical protein
VEKVYTNTSPSVCKLAATSRDVKNAIASRDAGNFHRPGGSLTPHAVDVMRKV